MNDFKILLINLALCMLCYCGVRAQSTIQFALVENTSDIGYGGISDCDNSTVCFNVMVDVPARYVGYQVANYNFWISTTNTSTSEAVVLPITSETTCSAANTFDQFGNAGNINVGGTDQSVDPMDFVLGANVLHNFCISYSSLDDLRGQTISVADVVSAIPSAMSLARVDSPFVTPHIAPGTLTLDMNSVSCLWQSRQDTTPPTIICAGDTVLTGCDTAILSSTNFMPISIDDPCGIDSVWYTETFTTSPIGDTLVRTWYAVDGCSNQGSCTQTLILIDSVRLSVRVMLAGPYDSETGMMNTWLNEYKLLPGQDPSTSTDALSQVFGTATDVGQPYDFSPWNHAGTEGDLFGDSSTNANPDVKPYDVNVVDWVLVSLRAGGIDESNTIWRCAGLLYRDGQVVLPSGCGCLDVQPSEVYHVVVEHRNHLPVMSEAITTVSGGLSIDFTGTPGWRLGLAGAQEANQQLMGSTYMMVSGNSDQSALGESSRTDINASDYVVTILPEFGVIRTYSEGDHDLNGDINAQDFTFHYTQNFGLFSFVF